MKILIEDENCSEVVVGRDDDGNLEIGYNYEEERMIVHEDDLLEALRALGVVDE